MAISNLIDEQLLMEAAQEGLKTIEYCENALRAVTNEQNIVDATAKRLQDLVDIITQQENQILDKFGISPGEDAEQQLQELFRNFYNGKKNNLFYI